MRTGILCTCSINAKFTNSAQFRCIVCFECTRRNNVHVQCSLSAHAPVHSAPAVCILIAWLSTLTGYTTTAPTGALIFLMYTVSGHIDTVGVYFHYMTCALCSLEASLLAEQSPSWYRCSLFRCLHVGGWFHRLCLRKAPISAIFGERDMHIPHQMVFKPSASAPLV